MEKQGAGFIARIKRDQRIFEKVPVGLIIRNLRKKRALKVYELAQRVGVNPVYITQIEKHNKLPAAERFYKILDVLEIDLGSLYLIQQMYIAQKFPRVSETISLFNEFKKKYPAVSPRQEQQLINKSRLLDAFCEKTG